MRQDGRQEFAVTVGNHSGQRPRALTNEPDDGQKTIGIVELFNYDKVDMRAEIGIFIDESCRGNGYGKAAVTELLNHCRDVLRLHQVVCDIAAGNTASLRLFESLGFERCGLMREWTATPNGWTDAVRMQKIL